MSTARLSLVISYYAFTKLMRNYKTKQCKIQIQTICNIIVNGDDEDADRSKETDDYHMPPAAPFFYQNQQLLCIMVLLIMISMMMVVMMKMVVNSLPCSPVLYKRRNTQGDFFLTGTPLKVSSTEKLI